MEYADKISGHLDSLSSKLDSTLYVMRPAGHPSCTGHVLEMNPILYCREGLRVHHADAVEWLHLYRVSGGADFDLVFVDAFDGENEVPPPFRNAGEDCHTNVIWIPPAFVNSGKLSTVGCHHAQI